LFSGSISPVVIAFHRIVWALLTLPIPCSAQPPGTGVISGSVLEVSNNDPVRKAIVTLTWQGAPRSWATSRTDSSGQFKFEGLPAGKYDLRATKPGEGTAIYGATRTTVAYRNLDDKLLSGQSRVVDQSGQFRIEGLAPGRYRVAAGESFDTIPVDSGREITVQEGQTATVDLHS